MSLRYMLATAVGAVLAAGAANATTVDLELQLLVDVSASVNGSEFQLQRDGYANAFRNAGIQAAITDTDGGNRKGKIAAQLIYWSSGSRQFTAVDWTLIDSTTAADDFAAAIGGTSRPFSGGTAPSSAISYGAPLFTGNGFEGDRLVMDVSGDGAGSRVSTRNARDAALDGSSTTDPIDRINGLPIGGSPSIEAYYRNHVIGGTDAFSLPVDDFAGFEDAVTRKIGAEITGGTPGGMSPIPLPASIPMLFSGLGLLGALRLRRKRTA